MNSNNNHCDLGFGLIVCIFLDGHIEATRPYQRIPCSKGEEWYVVPFGLGVRREDESAVGAGRRRRSQAIWCGGGKFS
jgi:hypothetical protein